MSFTVSHSSLYTFQKSLNLQTSGFSFQSFSSQTAHPTIRNSYNIKSFPRKTEKRIDRLSLHTHTERHGPRSVAFFIRYKNWARQWGGEILASSPRRAPPPEKPGSKMAFFSPFSATSRRRRARQFPYLCGAEGKKPLLAAAFLYTNPSRREKSV